MDEALLRGILKAHAKTPREFLYLETGATPIKYILAQRRINYLRHIISRSDNELIKKVFIAQKANPTRGDFIRLVEKDIAMLGITYEEVVFGQISKMQLKTIANTVAFQSLLVKLENHTKMKHIDYTTLSMQPYLKCEIFSSKEAILLTSLRSHCLRGIKGNFKKMYQNNLYCPLKCDTVNQPEDTQSHILLCQGLKKPQDNINVNLDLMTGSVQEQHK